MLQPDFRAIALTEGADPVGPLEQGLVDLLANKPAPPEVVSARDIYEDPYKSEVLEAFILTRTSPETVSSTVGIATKVVEAYQHLFFDRSVFQDELDVEAYVQNYPENSKEQKWGKDLKLAGITMGSEYLIYRFGRKDGDIDLAGALKSIIVNSYMLTKVTKLNPLDSTAAREARQWAATAIKALEAYVRVKPMTENTDDDFKVALENIERATNEARSGISKADLVH